MARYTDAVCKLCRREGTKLYLKGERCYKDKCAMEKKAYAPGQHGQSRKKPTDYGIQLREKQKTKRIYGILEKQFRLYYKKAHNMDGIAGENLLVLLESRLDNMVYRAGFATSRAQARQLVNHSHFIVDGKKVNIPSYLVKAGQVVEVREKSRGNAQIKASLETSDGRGTPEWLVVDKGTLKATVNREPQRSDIGYEISENLIVELYSR